MADSGAVPPVRAQRRRFGRPAHGRCAEPAH